MNFIEFLTIYLAIGAAFGAHYYLNQRRAFSTKLFLQTLSATLLWIFYFSKLTYASLLSPLNTSKQNVLDLSLEQQIECTKRDLQTSFVNLMIDDELISFFSFDEMIERYIGLSLALQNSAIESQPIASETEIFRVSGFDKKEVEIAGRCLHRKNFLKLKAHQLFARQETIDTLEKISQNVLSKRDDDVFPDTISEEWREFQRNILHLFDILFDKQSENSAKRLFAENQNTIADKENQNALYNPKRPTSRLPISSNKTTLITKKSEIF